MLEIDGRRLDSNVNISSLTPLRFFTQDVIDFTIAIFDYVYTLSEKYEKYVARKAAPPSTEG